MLASAAASDKGATVVREFPHAIREVEHAWIELADGIRLAVRYWLPVDAEANPVPGILEYIPYCKRDGTAARDEAMHPYFAGHGYAAVRVDMRGSGESEGLLHDEYLKQEQDDALEVIAWIAEQPWCTGDVGMMGKSWGGFNGLQVAARRPPALKCVISVYSTVDRYADDIHYMGGCLLANNPGWGFVMFGGDARPPDPKHVGDRWRDLWMARLEANRPWIIEWLRHQRRDAFWKHGSVCEDYSAIECPVFAVGGWADGYTNAVPRLLEGLKSPCKGLVGPWGHQYPHQANPAPMAGFLQEALRWWDHWLKGKDTGVMREPCYRVWMQDSVEPSAFYASRPGEWVAETEWPSPRIEQREYALNLDGLAPSAGDEAPLTTTCPVTAGLQSPAWSNHGDGGPENPLDQRADDARSITFDSAPLDAPLEILGAPRVTLDVSVDRRLAFVCVRLNDIAPDGASTRVTYGLHNLTHDANHEQVVPVEPGGRRTVTVTLNDIAHRFAAGHRLRVSVATSNWPVIWPSPEPVTLTVFAGSGRLSLPTRPPRAEDADLRPVDPPEIAAVHPVTVVRPAGGEEASVTRDVATGRVTMTDRADAGKVRVDRDGWTFGKRGSVERSVVEGDPLSARIELRGELEFSREGEIDVRIETYTLMTCTRDAFQVSARLDAYEDDRPAFNRSWSEVIPRDGL